MPEYDQEKPGPPDRAQLVGDLDLELGEVDLRLLTSRRLVNSAAIRR